jgi:hypothetical protein
MRCRVERWDENVEHAAVGFAAHELEAVAGRIAARAASASLESHDSSVLRDERPTRMRCRRRRCRIVRIVLMTLVDRSSRA